MAFSYSSDSFTHSQGFASNARRPRNVTKERKFQSTNFGLSRNKDEIPAWKQRMMNRILSSSRRNRDSLMKKLQNQRQSQTNNNSNNSNNNNNNNRSNNNLKDNKTESKENNNLFNNSTFGNTLNTSFGNFSKFSFDTTNNKNNENENGVNCMNSMNSMNSINSNVGSNGINCNFSNLSLSPSEKEKCFAIYNDTIETWTREQIESDKTNPSWKNVSEKDYEDIVVMVEMEILNEVRNQIQQWLAIDYEEYTKDLENAEMNELDLENIVNNNDNNYCTYNNNNNNNASNICNNTNNNSIDAVVCPICNGDVIGVEDFELESKINEFTKMKIYSCPNFACGARWQSSENELRFPTKIQCCNSQDFIISNNNHNNHNNNNIGNNNGIQYRYETDKEHSQRLFKSLKATLNSVFMAHHNQTGCMRKLNFTVENQTKLLQTWCNQCRFNALL